MSVWLLFAGRDYYPSGGADDCVGSFEGDQAAALAWAESVDVDSGTDWWDAYEWKHLATVRNGLEIVKRWEREAGQELTSWAEADLG